MAGSRPGEGGVGQPRGYLSSRHEERAGPICLLEPWGAPNPLNRGLRTAGARPGKHTGLGSWRCCVAPSRSPNFSVSLSPQTGGQPALQHGCSNEWDNMRGHVAPGRFPLLLPLTVPAWGSPKGSPLDIPPPSPRPSELRPLPRLRLSPGSFSLPEFPLLGHFDLSFLSKAHQIETGMAVFRRCGLHQWEASPADSRLPPK